MKLSDIKVDIKETIGENFLIIDKSVPAYKYVNGTKTDVIEGVKVNCFCQKIWTTVTVKVTEIPDFDFEGEPIRVTFENLHGKAYLTNGDYKLSLTADRVVPVEKNNTTRLKVGKGE